jgi:preprotein translocase subunit SecD
VKRYAFWQYIVIAFVLAGGLVYTLPNFYGESPAVQVSSSRAGVEIDGALMQRIAAVLDEAAIPYNGETLDATGVRVRFASADSQLEAKAALEAKLGDRYIVAINALSSSPQWLTSIGALPMHLGLDLRGGVYFLLQVDSKSALDKTIDRYTADIRTLLQEKKVQYSGVAREGSNIVVRLRDGVERTRARNQIAIAFADLAQREAEGFDGELRLVASLRPEAATQIRLNAVAQNAQILRNRVNELGVAEPVIQQQGADRIAVQLPGVQDTARAKDILGRTAALEIRMVNEEQGAQDRALAGQVPLGSELLAMRGGGAILVRRTVALAGRHLIDAQPAFDPTSSAPVVNIVLDNAGARIFGALSRENIGKRMAVVLAERGKSEVIMAPAILAEIGNGRIVIIGTMSTRETSDLSLMMRAGALAAPMEIVEERAIGPSLGKENVDKGFNSVAYGIAALAIFMCVYYLLMGLISVIGLTVNLVLLIAILSMLQATLTLPGIAAIALTLGMAIDANVLINERIREELRWGATPHAALQAGYERAWSTILDSNVTTLIAGIALLGFGTGPVRGFAVVHCLGIMTSMFSAVFVSRGIANLIYGNRENLERISIGQVWKPEAPTSAPQPKTQFNP